jgi:archaellum component FlaC
MTKQEFDENFPEIKAAFDNARKQLREIDEEATRILALSKEDPRKGYEEFIKHLDDTKEV